MEQGNHPPSDQSNNHIPECPPHQPDRQTLIYFHKFTPQQRTILKGSLLWNELLLIDADLCSVTIITKTFQFDTQYYRYGPRAESDPKLPSPNSQLKLRNWWSRPSDSLDHAFSHQRSIVSITIQNENLSRGGERKKKIYIN